MPTNSEHKTLNVPPLRFPEFTEEWRYCKLKDCSTFRNGKAHESLVDENAPYILINSKFISTEGRVFKKVKSLLSQLKKDEITIVMSDLPNGKALSKCYYIDENNKYTLNQRIGAITVNKNFNSRFIKYQINRNRYYLRFDDGVNQTNLRKEEVVECPIYYPAAQEQVKIATFFLLLEERIKLQIKIIEDLEATKIAILKSHYLKSNMITCKISDLGKSIKGGNLSKEDLSEDGQECILYGELFTRYNCSINKIYSHTHKKSNMVISKQGDLLFPCSTTVDAISLISPSAINVDNVILGGDIFAIRVNHNFNSNYLSYYFNYLAKQDLAKYAVGSTIIHLHYNDIKNVKLLLPSKYEQDRVLSSLLTLEKRITTEESILQNLKKGKDYLVKMMYVP